MTPDSYGDLHDYKTGEFIRPATEREYLASITESERDGGAGVIEVDGRACYVQGDAMLAAREVKQ